MYQCSLCQAKVENDLIAYRDHTEGHIAELIKRDHPEWAQGDGVCPKCLDYYRAQIKGTPFQDESVSAKTSRSKKVLSAIRNISKT